MPNESSAYIVVSTSAGGGPTAVSLWKLLVEGNREYIPFLMKLDSRCPSGESPDTVTQKEPTPDAQLDGLSNQDFRNPPWWPKLILALVALAVGITVQSIQW